MTQSADPRRRARRGGAPPVAVLVRALVPAVYAAALLAGVYAPERTWSLVAVSILASFTAYFLWRIHGEMQAIMRQVGFDGTLQDFFRYLRTEERFYFPNTGEGKQAYLDLAVELITGVSERLDELFLRRPPADAAILRCM